MILVDEVSSRGAEFQLPMDVIDELRQDEEFINNLRKSVRLMVRSWGWVCVIILNLRITCFIFKGY